MNSSISTPRYAPVFLRCSGLGRFGSLSKFQMSHGVVIPIFIGRSQSSSHQGCS